MLLLQIDNNHLGIFTFHIPSLNVKDLTQTYTWKRKVINGALTRLVVNYEYMQLNLLISL